MTWHGLPTPRTLTFLPQGGRAVGALRLRALCASGLPAFSHLPSPWSFFTAGSRPNLG